MRKAILKKDDKLAFGFIGVVSFVVFAAVVLLSKITLDINLGFNPHVFASINAVINSAVSVLLVAALIAVKQKNYNLHRNLMMSAIVLSTLFLVSYIAHHLFAGDTAFGGQGAVRIFYFIILISHIILAAVILPFILLTAYRALTAEFQAHKKIAYYTFPLWLYVSVTGVLVYVLISPYYS